MNRIINRKHPLLHPASFLLAAGLAGLVGLGGCTIQSSDSPTATNTCSQDAAVAGCTGTALGFSCTGSETPAQTNAALSCGAGISGGNGETLYCCNTTGGAACTADPSVTGCTNGSTGYSCTGGETPTQTDASLTCAAGVAGLNGALDYCCTPGATATCAPDNTVAGCTNGSTGYSCTGGETPPQIDASLTCGTGAAGANGALDYCCTAGASGTCAPDNTVQGCTGNSTGYSCTGPDAPNQSDATLACSTGTAGNGDTLYCCVSLNGSTCMEDPTVQGCTGSSFGFSCTGADTPTQGNASLVCSTGTPSNGETLYCCTD